MSRICSPRIERNTFNLHEVFKKDSPLRTPNKSLFSLGNLHHFHKEGLQFNSTDDFHVHLWPTCLRKIVFEEFSSNFANSWVAIDFTLFWFIPSLPSLCSFPAFVPWLGKPEVCKETTNCVFLRFPTKLMKREEERDNILISKGWKEIQSTVY